MHQVGELEGRQDTAEKKNVTSSSLVGESSYTVATTELAKYRPSPQSLQAINITASPTSFIQPSIQQPHSTMNRDHDAIIEEPNDSQAAMAMGGVLDNCSMQS